MSEEEKNRATFTLKDITALRWLAVSLGVVFAGLCIVSRGSDQALLLAAALVLAMMILCPLAIFYVRKRKSRSNEKG